MVEWRPGALYPHVEFIVTNMTGPPERVVMFYNQRGTAEQCIKEGKSAIVSTRLSCHRFAASAVRLQLHVPDIPPHPDLARAGLPLVDDDTARAVGQDLREVRSSGTLDHVPDGRGHGLTQVISSNPRRNRNAASVATSAMLSDDDITNRVNHRQEMGVPMSAGSAAIASEQRRYRRSLGEPRHYGATGIARRLEPGLSFA
jgi:hypothetical protein